MKKLISESKIITKIEKVEDGLKITYLDGHVEIIELGD